jgi:hypothetical protein
LILCVQQAQLYSRWASDVVLPSSTVIRFLLDEDCLWIIVVLVVLSRGWLELRVA